MIGRDVALPISSSVFQIITIRGAVFARCMRTARTASIADRETGLHVEDARTMEPAILLAQRHPFELTERPHGIEVSEEHDLTPAAAELGAQVIASLRLGESLDSPADRFEPGGNLSSAPVDCSLVGARRLETDERLDRVAEPALFIAAPCQQIGVFAFHELHSASPALRLRAYNRQMPLRIRSVLAIAAVVSLGVTSTSAQTPVPFPKPAQPQKPAPQAPPPGTPERPGSPAAPTAANQPTEAMLGMPIYPGADFIASFDAGRGQRYYLFGTNATFAEIVNYYKTTLKQRGELVYEEPPVHMFDVGRFREEAMAFPPGVSVKDYTWGGSAGYLNPKRSAQPERYKTIIQIVPAPGGAAGR